MTPETDRLSEAIEGIIFQSLLDGEARTLREAEERSLDAILPQLLELLAGPLSNEELSRLPVFQRMLAHGSRGWEDSVL